MRLLDQYVYIYWNDYYTKWLHYLYLYILHIVLPNLPLHRYYVCYLWLLTFNCYFTSIAKKLHHCFYVITELEWFLHITLPCPIFLSWWIIFTFFSLLLLPFGFIFVVFKSFGPLRLFLGIYYDQFQSHLWLFFVFHFHCFSSCHLYSVLPPHCHFILILFEQYLFFIISGEDEEHHLLLCIFAPNYYWQISICGNWFNFLTSSGLGISPSSSMTYNFGYIFKSKKLKLVMSSLLSFHYPSQ